MLPVSPIMDIEASSNQRSQRFSQKEIRSATRNFNDALIIGRGGFGNVYKGDLKTHESSTNVVAIKRSNSISNQGAPEFKAEVEMLSKIRHCNLVSLIGYCNQKREMVLVYEYMPHGTLDEHLHKTNASLSWLQRLKICIGAARGLDYLHTGTGARHGIIHRDVKSSNILLDENFEAKVSDFGLAKIGPTNQTRTYVSTGVKGTFGYMDPCYFNTGKLTIKSDVYAFGVVLLEVLCGRPAVDSSLREDQWGLVAWAQNRIKKRKVNQIIDYRIRGQISNKCMKDFAHVACRCLHNKPNKRPTMAEIVSKLQVILASQERLNFSSLTKGKFIDRLLVLFFGAKVKSNSISFISDATTSSSQSVPSDEAGNDVTSAMRNLRRFTFDELKKATRNFRLGTVTLQGHSTSVFKGWIDEPSLAAVKPGAVAAVAVKKFDINSPQDQQEWLAELNYLTVLSHPNLIKLIGYCQEDESRLLVYEFMTRGSLEDQLFKRGSYFTPLSWDLRIKVVLGAANGLAYLHSPEVKVICCDFKSSAILIDSKYNAKLSNFGSVKDAPVDGKCHVSTQVMPTNGYAAPEYIATGQVTTKSDIYSFGVVLLEILTGMRCLDKNRPCHEYILTEFVKPLLATKRGILGILDSRIHDQYTLAVAKKLSKLAQKCLSEKSKDRPTADEVVKALEKIQDLLQNTAQGSRRKHVAVGENPYSDESYTDDGLYEDYMSSG